MVSLRDIVVKCLFPWIRYFSIWAYFICIWDFPLKFLFEKDIYTWVLMKSLIMGTFLIILFWTPEAIGSKQLQLMLVLNAYGGYFTEFFFLKLNTNLAIIPGGIISYLQMLAVIVNECLNCRNHEWSYRMNENNIF